MFELRNITKMVGTETHLSEISLSLEHGSLNVLLGPTLAGKTSLMRIMAGLDRPTSGDVIMDGTNVTGVSVKKRNVAMVYQQFINYPNLTVYENIASPLRIAGVDSTTIDKEVKEAADLLKLGPYLDRTPLNLSGGQQQRCALARAIVKQAGLVLLDEPLANLDYKLREELRSELPRIFSKSGAIFVYSTTEPSEALLLGGNTASLHEGRLSQFGLTTDVFRKPVDLVTAQTFSDPPLNVAHVQKSGDVFTLQDISVPVPTSVGQLPDGPYTIGFRAHHLSLKPHKESHIGLSGKVTVTEITGSQSFVHLSCAGEAWVMLEKGVHDFAPGSDVSFHLDTRHLLVFDPAGKTVASADRLAA